MSTALTTRTVTIGRKRSKKSGGSGGSGFKMPMPYAPVPAAIKSRGTPKGYYEITRTSNLYVKIVNGQFTNDAVTIAGEGLGFTFSPQFTRTYLGSNALNTLPVSNAAELSALFDEIKIKKVEMTFNLGIGTAPATAVSFNPLQIIYAIDDNSVTDSTYVGIQQMSGCKQWYGSTSDNGQRKVTIYPKFQRVIYYTALLSGYEPASAYIRSDYDIEHYGLKMAMVPTPDAATTGPNGRLSICVKYTYFCKSLK